MSDSRDALRLGEEYRDWGSEEIEPYIPVFNAVNFNALTSIALEIRTKLEKRGSGQEDLSCSIEKNILGSYNIISVIIFSDGLKWVAKIPRYGISKTFGRLNQQKIISEALTLRLIRSKTEIPAPDVYDWDTTSKKIGVPYVLTSFLPGTTLDKLWFDEKWATEERRVFVLRNLAQLMAEFHKLHFKKIGALYFDENGKFLKIGKFISQTEGDIFHPQYDMVDGHQTIRWPEPSILGPFDTAKSYLLSGVEALEAEKGLGKVAIKQRKADVAILRLAIYSIPDRLTKDGSFVLAHPNFDSANILIDDEGQVTGLLDWDCVHTIPRSYGFSRYPSWITHDWDPVMYNYGDLDINENSPEELSKYRQIYAAAFANLNLPPGDYFSDETRLSHIYEAICIAATSFWDLSPIDKLLQHAFCGPKVQDFDVDTFRGALADEIETGKDNERISKIWDAFRNMWHPEWEYR